MIQATVGADKTPSVDKGAIIDLHGIFARGCDFGIKWPVAAVARYRELCGEGGQAGVGLAPLAPMT